MKNLLYLFIAISIAVGSCDSRDNRSDNSSAEKGHVIKEQVLRPESCDGFLDEFEEWSAKYAGVLEQFRRSPGNPNSAKKYNVVSQELIEWQTDWDNFQECSQNEEYAKRYKVISQKIKMEQRRLEGI